MGNLEKNNINKNENYELSNSYRAYLKEIDKIPLLSHEEENRLFTLYRQNHDKEIFNKICESNLRLVVFIANKQFRKIKDDNYNVALLDLIQEGNFGLMYAIDGFTYGDHFSTYATYCITDFILRGIYNKASMIRIPVNLIEKKMKVDRAIGEYTSIYPTIPTKEELVKITGLNMNDIERCLKCDNSVISLDNEINDENDKILDFISDTVSTEDDAIDNYIHDYVNNILEEELNEKSRDIIKLYYGFEDKGIHSFNSIGKHYGVTGERIKQINNKALKQLSNNPKIKKLKKDFF